MIAKSARRRMLRALDEYVVHGVQTGIDLHRRILVHPAFIAGDVTTVFLDDYGHEILIGPGGDVPDEAFIAAALSDVLNVARAPGGSLNAPTASPWERVGKWEIGGSE